MENSTQQQVNMSARDSLAGSAKAPVGDIKTPGELANKKQGKGKVWLIVLIVIVLAGVAFGGGVLAERFLISSDGGKDDDGGVTVEEVLDAIDNEQVDVAQVVNGGVNNVMAAEYDEVYNIMKIAIGEMKTDIGSIILNMDGIHASFGMPMRPEGLHTYIPAKFNLKVSVNGDDDSDATMGAIGANLENVGFVTTGEIPHFGAAGSLGKGYERGSIRCNMYSTFAVSYSHTVAVECGMVDWVWLNDDKFKMYQDLEEAYRAKNGKYPWVLSINHEIVDSEYVPYQKVAVNVGGAVGLFYRASSESEWQFFAATQGSFPCSEYNTDDLKKAYLGEGCFDETNGVNSVVSL